jgi:putative membrane protein
MTRYHQTSRAVLTALLAGALLVGCGDDDGDDDDTPNNDGGGQTTGDGGREAGAGGDAGSDGGMDGGSNLDASTDGGSQPDAGRLNDNQIVGVATTVNSGEISAGTLAAMKGTLQAVKNYANLMITDHTAADARQRMLGAPADSELSAGLRASAMTVMTSLTNAPMGPVFDRLYIESQVTMHQMTVQTIDSILLRDAMSQALRNELTATRATVAGHLTMAQSILASLGDAGVPDASVSSVPADAGMDGG